MRSRSRSTTRRGSPLPSRTPTSGRPSKSASAKKKPEVRCQVQRELRSRQFVSRCYWNEFVSDLFCRGLVKNQTCLTVFALTTTFWCQLWYPHQNRKVTKILCQSLEYLIFYQTSGLRFLFQVTFLWTFKNFIVELENLGSIPALSNCLFAPRVEAVRNWLDLDMLKFYSCMSAKCMAKNLSSPEMSLKRPFKHWASFYHGCWKKQ